MTLKSLKHVFAAMLMAALFFPANDAAHGQLPFDNLTPTEDAEADPAAQERPARPVEAAIGESASQRPLDDELDGDDLPTQSVEVNERFAGWQQAGDIDGQRISDKLRANWVMLDRNGEFSGTVRGIDNAEVAGMTIFLMNRGRLVKTAAVQADGTFRFTNVQRGTYAFVGWGDKAFFAFGANIINYNRDAVDAPTSVDCYAFQNETTINTDWIRYFAPNTTYRVYGRYSSGEGPSDPDSLYGFDGLTRNAVAASPSTSIGGTPVSLDSRGRLVGRIHQLNTLNGRPVDVRSTKVMLLKNDDVVASTTTDNFGIFQFSGVPSGGYGLVAVSVDGVGSVGIQVAGESSSVIDAEGAVRPIDEEAEPFDFCLVSSETVGWMNHYADEVAYRRAILAPRTQAFASQEPQDNFCPTCLGIMGPGGCPKCGTGQRNPICNSQCTTFQQWQAAGCACQPNKPTWIRIGDRIREGAERLDDGFERAFYGDQGTGGFNNQPAFNGGFGANLQGQPPVPVARKLQSPVR